MTAAEGWLEEQHALVTTEINVYETLLGIELEESTTRRRRFRENFHLILDRIDVLPWSRTSTELACKRQADLYRVGKPAGSHDLLIAAIAKSEGCGGVATRNLADYARINLLPTVAY